MYSRSRLDKGLREFAKTISRQPLSRVAVSGWPHRQKLLAIPNAPSHFRILSCNLPEGGLRRLKRKRVQQRNSTFKLILYGWRAGSRKMYRTQFLFRHVMFGTVFRERLCGKGKSQKEQCG
jgi:hypothetical protein